MSRRPATSTKTDLKRAMDVAREHGMTVEVLPDGTLRIVPVANTLGTFPPLAVAVI